MDVVVPLLTDCIALALQIGASYVVYRNYKRDAKCLKSLKEAKHFELNEELMKNVEKSGGIIKYAVISGNVKALAAPLRSQYFPYLRGVIREKITREYKIKLRQLLKFWSSANQDHQYSIHCIPFALSSKSGSLFKKQVMIEVLEPLVGQELVLPTVNDEFTFLLNKTVFDTMLWWEIPIGREDFEKFFFERIQEIERILLDGMQEIERLLCENETLTAVGKLVIEDNKLKIKPPDDGLKYFITPLSLESLINKISAETAISKVFAVIMGTCSLAFFVYVLGRAFSRVKKKIQHNQLKKQLKDQRRWRSIVDISRNCHNANIPKCVICLEYPVEVLILECGHSCLCYSCAERVKTLCPVCRNPIERFVSTMWP